MRCRAGSPDTTIQPGLFQQAAHGRGLSLVKQGIDMPKTQIYLPKGQNGGKLLVSKREPNW